MCYFRQDVEQHTSHTEYQDEGSYRQQPFVEIS